MNSGSNKLDTLRHVIAKIPHNTLRDITIDLASDTLLNPYQIPPDQIAGRFSKIDLAVDTDIIGRDKIESLLGLVQQTEMYNSKSLLWQENLNAQSRLGQAARELRESAKEVLASITQLDKEVIDRTNKP